MPIKYLSCMYVLLSILYQKSIELIIISTLLTSTYKNISCRKSHLLVLLFVEMLPALRFTNASKWNTFNSEWMPEKFQLDGTICFTWGCDKRFSKIFINLWITHSNFIEIQPNFNTKQSRILKSKSEWTIMVHLKPFKCFIW